MFPDEVCRPPDEVKSSPTFLSIIGIILQHRKPGFQCMCPSLPPSDRASLHGSTQLLACLQLLRLSCAGAVPFTALFTILFWLIEVCASVSANRQTCSTADIS